MFIFKKTIWVATAAVLLLLSSVEAKAFHSDQIPAQMAALHDYMLVRDITPEQKELIRQRIEEKYGHLTEAERAEKLQQLREKRQALRAELEQLPPEARKARMEELKKELAASNESGPSQAED